MIAASLMLVSCVETLILPDDKTVEEQFWKSKADVQLMVNGAYQGMVAEKLVERLIVWGDLRSEEVVPVSTVTGTLPEDLIEINLGSTQVDNQFADWGAVYDVINRCNLVLAKAAAVMSEDPSYTEGDYLADCSQMLALRSLCYFYLVRNYRDVPYITNAYTDSSQDRNVPQSSPADVLQGCLDDLAIAEKNAISASAYTDWRRVGYMTRDAINALQADIYLWRASVTHSADDYEQVVAYCDKVIESKRAQHIKQRGEVEEKDYWLAEGLQAYPYLYVMKNAEESIFELQMAVNVNNNTAVAKYFNHYSDNVSNPPYLYASSIFMAGTTGEVFRSTNSTSGATDWRGLTSTFNSTVSAGDFEGLEIRKYVSAKVNYTPGNTKVESKDTKDNTSASYSTSLGMNYIIYRLTDVMLMKAEALTALATGNDDLEHLQTAFELVRVVNLRSRESKDDELKWATFGTQDDVVAAIEKLVLAERLRELCFEGKRWYDLLRFNYRHVEGVDYNTTLYAQDEAGKTPVGVYDEMLNLMKRKLAGKGNAVAAKINTEGRLYMPIPMSDVDICPALHQTPGYSVDDTYNKNY